MLLACGLVTLSAVKNALPGLVFATFVMLMGQLISFILMAGVFPARSPLTITTEYQHEKDGRRRRRIRRANASGLPAMSRMPR